MATPPNENFDQAYTEKNLMPGVTFAESPLEKSNSRACYSEKRRMNVQHLLQAASVIIGKDDIVLN
jgi:hypothetical protein